MTQNKNNISIPEIKLHIGVSHPAGRLAVVMDGRALTV